MWVSDMIPCIRNLWVRFLIIKKIISSYKKEEVHKVLMCLEEVENGGLNVW